jgi:fatty-acid desaturase
VDVSYWFIRALSWLGLAWKVRLPASEEQRV